MLLRASPPRSISVLLLLLAFSAAPSVRSDPCGAGQTEVSAKCPIRCFRADPVCGVNGVTYWCGCPEAACEVVEVARAGPCQVGSAVPGQALLLVHIVWLIVLAFSVVFGFF
uniref:Uncharacterized protein n=1 Tax=Kalanchoe fedtschenkoi TaxID=63787 RepID=A0A7N0REA5_KALFE